MRKLVDENAAFFSDLQSESIDPCSHIHQQKFYTIDFYISHHDNPCYNEQFQRPGLPLSINDSYVKNI